MVALDNLLIEVACPACGGVIRQTVRWFKRPGPHCSRGCTVFFDNDRFAAMIAQAEGSITRAIGSLVAIPTPRQADSGIADSSPKEAFQVIHHEGDGRLLAPVKLKAS